MLHAEIYFKNLNGLQKQKSRVYEAKSSSLILVIEMVYLKYTALEISY